MLLNTDKVAHAVDVEMPESAIRASKNDGWLLGADVLISLPSLENSKAVLAGMTEARAAKFDKVAAEAGLTKKLDATRLRVVSVAYPSKSYAANQQLDYAGYEQMIWAGIGADYAAVAAQAQRLKQRLATGKRVHITSPAGTDLTLQLAGRPVFTDDGVVTAADQQEKLMLSRTAALPGGRVYGTCQETSATGRLAASPATWNGKPLQGLTGELKNGQLTNVRADVGNDDVQQWLAANDASVAQVGYFSIGLNPAMKPQEQKGYNPDTAAGMVYVGTGNNALLGGTNQATSGNSYPIANATVEVDGTVVVRNGQLVSPATAQAAPAGKQARK